MRTSQSVSIYPILAQAINAIEESFEREKKSLELREKFFKKESERPEGTAPKAQLECPSREQYIQDVLGPPPTNEAALTKYRIRGEVLMQHPPITRPNIENAYLWRHQAVHAVNWLVQCGWTTEAQAIADVLDGLPKKADPVDWQQPGVLVEQLGAIREGAKRVREILHSCIREMLSQASECDNHDKSSTQSVNQEAMKELIESGALGAVAGEMLKKSNELRRLQREWEKNKSQKGTKKTFGIEKYNRKVYLEKLLTKVSSVSNG